MYYIFVSNLKRFFAYITAIIILHLMKSYLIIIDNITYKIDLTITYEVTFVVSSI